MDKAQRLVLLSTTLDMFLEGVFITLPSISALLSSVPAWAEPLLFLTIPVGTLVGNLLIGRLTDVRGRKSAYIMMLLVYAVGAALIVTATGLYQLLAGLLITQTAMGGEVPIVLSYIVESSPAESKERLVVIVTNVGNIGALAVSWLAMSTGGLSATAGRYAIAALIGGALTIMVITRTLVPESRPWLSLSPSERGRVDLSFPGAKLWTAILTLMAISSVLTFGLLALYIGPAEFKNMTYQILVVYFAGEAAGGAAAAAMVGRLGSRSTTLISFAGGLATTLAAAAVLGLGAAPFLALLFINGAFTEMVWASRNVLESLTFPTTFRATAISLVRVVPYLLMIASFYLTSSMNQVQYLAYAAAMWGLGVVGSVLWSLKGVEVVGRPLVMRPEELARRGKVSE